MILLFCLLTAITSYKGQAQSKISINKSNGHIISFAGLPKITLPKGISPQTMFRCSLKDNGGNLWFGTTGAGVYKYDGKSFTRYAEKEGLTSTFVTGIAQDKRGNIWVATDNGIFCSKGGLFSSLEIPVFDGSNASSTLGIASSNASNKKLQVYCIVGDKKGNIWFGTEGQGLWRYNGATFTNFKCIDSTWIEVSTGGSANYKQNGFVSALLEDKNGNIWISSSLTCLTYYDGKTFHSLNINHSRHHTLQMIEDRSGNIWMATRLDGICRFNGKKIQSFTEKDGITDNMASCLYEAGNGNIWFGSLGKAGTGGSGLKGVTVYNGKTFTHISSKGMRNNQVWTVIEDNPGNVWIGTKEFGLFRYDGEKFTEFTTL